MKCLEAKYPMKKSKEKNTTALSRLREMTPDGSCRSYFAYTECKVVFLSSIYVPTSCNCDNIPSTTTFSDFEPAANKCSIVFNCNNNHHDRIISAKDFT